METMKTIDSIESAIFESAREWVCLHDADGNQEKGNTVEMILRLVSDCVGDLMMPDMEPIVRAVCHYITTKAKGEEADKAVESLTKLLEIKSRIDDTRPYFEILSFGVEDYLEQKLLFQINGN